MEENKNNNNRENADRNIRHFAVLVIILFALVAVSPWVLSLAFGDDVASEEEGGLTEKRELTEFPVTMSNDWFSRFESFYSDHSPFRNSLIYFETTVSQKYETYYRNNIDPKLTQLFMGDASENASGEEGGNAGDDADEELPTIDMSDFNDLFGNTPTPTLTPEPIGTPSPVPGETPSAEAPATPAPSTSSETAPATGTVTAKPATPTPDGGGRTPAPHEHRYDSGRIVRNATCTEAGERVYTCAECGDTKTEEIPATGHKYSTVKTQNADQEHYGYILSKCSTCGYYNLEITGNKKTSTSYLAPRSAGGAIYGRNDWLFYEGDNSIGYYQGTNVLDNGTMNSWRHTFEKLREACDKKGIHLVVMAAPNKEQAYPEYMPSYQRQSTPKRQEVFLDYMQQHSSVKYLYPLSDLNTAKYLYDVFYKQDTHWNSIGGFMGTMAVYRALGMDTTNLLELTVNETKRTGGDLSNFCGYSTTYTDYQVEYKTNVKVNTKYFPDNSVGSEVELVQFTSDSPNRSKIVVIGDSFRHSMEQYLARDFAKATVCHRSDFYNNHYAVQNALKELSVGDVLLLLAVERYDGDNVNIANSLIGFWG